MARKLEMIDGKQTSIRVSGVQWDFVKNNNLNFSSIARQGIDDLMAGGSVLTKSDLEQIRNNLVNRLQTTTRIIESILTAEEHKQFLKKVEASL